MSSLLRDTTHLDAFLPFVMAAAPDLPQAMAQAYTRQACIDFCARSGWLRREVAIDIQHGVREYPIWPEPCERVLRVSEVAVDGTPYHGRRDTMMFHHCGAAFTVANGMVRISSDPTEDRHGAMRVKFIATPARDACEVDASLYDDWQDAIEDGALAKILKLPKYGFTDLRLSAERAQRFDDAITRARVRAMKSETSAATRLVAPAFV